MVELSGIEPLTFAIPLFQRHNSILVIFYLVFFPPIANCLMLLLSIFGSSKRQGFLRKAEGEAKRQLEIEKTKARERMQG